MRITAEVLLLQLTQVCIVGFSKHPAVMRVGTKWERCLVCKGTWEHDTPVRHQLVLYSGAKIICPLVPAEHYFYGKKPA